MAVLAFRRQRYVHDRPDHQQVVLTRYIEHRHVVDGTQLDRGTCTAGPRAACLGIDRLVLGPANAKRRSLSQSEAKHLLSVSRVQLLNRRFKVDPIRMHRFGDFERCRRDVVKGRPVRVESTPWQENLLGGGYIYAVVDCGGNA